MASHDLGATLRPVTLSDCLRNPQEAHVWFYVNFNITVTPIMKADVDKSLMRDSLTSLRKYAY